MWRSASRPFGRALRVLVAATWLHGASIALATEAGSDAGIISRIPRQLVDSRALHAVGYSKRLHALEIEFRRGGTYRYLNVPIELHRQLLAAESKAKFYNQHIRGKYRSVYVRPRRKR